MTRSLVLKFCLWEDIRQWWFFFLMVYSKMKKNMFIKAHIPLYYFLNFISLLYFILQTVKYTSLGTMSQDCDLGKETKKKEMWEKEKKWKIWRPIKDKKKTAKISKILLLVILLQKKMESSQGRGSRRCQYIKVLSVKDSIW